jgi:sigma-B regulation protein RsbU (phosphoserine phosphatase)
MFAAIFEPLARGETEWNKKKQKHEGGLGLGLYIAREIARAHDGSIDVSSSEQQGTTFTVRLPRAS